MEETKTPEVLTVDGVEYTINDLSETARACITHIRKLDVNIGELIFNLDEAKVARTGFIELLKVELAKPKEESKE